LKVTAIITGTGQGPALRIVPDLGDELTHALDRVEGRRLALAV
jgi:hypothetical protein